MEILTTLLILAVLYGTYLFFKERAKIKQQEVERRQRESQEREAERLRLLRVAEEQKKQRIRQQEAEQQRKIQEQERLQAAIREEERIRQKQALQEARIHAIKALQEQTRQEQAAKLQQEKAELEIKENEKIKRQLLQLNLSSERKSNCEEFKRILQENRILTLYHFTDRANIPSIKENGALLSWWYCEQNDIAILKPGSDETSKSLDRRYNLEDYVRLSFTPNHPMMYVAKSQGRIQDPIVLKINPEICLFEGTKFSDMNATKTGHNCGSTLEDLMRVRFAVVRQNKHFDLSDEDKPYYQAEVLVKTRLPIEWITNINTF